MQATPIKLSKFISSPKILKANQMLITLFPPLQNYNFACCFVWVWNLVAPTDGGT